MFIVNNIVHDQIATKSIPQLLNFEVYKSSVFFRVNKGSGVILAFKIAI